MKKYSKPIVKACGIRMASILVGSDPKLNNGYGDGTTLSNDRNNFFSEDEEAAW